MTDWTSVISHLIPLVVAVCFITFSVIRALKQRAATARIEREILRARRPPPPPPQPPARRYASSPLPPPPPQPPPAPRPPKKPAQPRYIVLAVPLEGVDPTGPNGQFTNKREAEVFARRLARNEPTSEVVVVRVKDEQYTLVIPPRDVPHIIAEGDQVRDEEEI